MQRSMLVASHGDTVALRRGALAISGHDKSRQEAQELCGDDVDLSKLSRVQVEAPAKVSTCAAVRR